jgi:uncharacterized membrane protein YjgN (DUF898 family)
MATALNPFGPRVGAVVTETAETAHQLAYTGRTRTLFGIFFKNLLLTLLTVGVYRFWAKTRTRRFLWSGTSIDGEPFEYAGTGKEMFIGFLKALAILAPLFAALQVGQLWLGKGQSWLSIVLQYGQTLLVVVLIYVGSYAARRYRMSRTLWSGIRFRQAGSAWRYVGHAMLGLFFCVITLGFYFPYFQTRLLRYEMDNLRFGTAPFRFTGRGRELLGRFVLCWILGLAIYIAFSAAIIGAIIAAMKTGSLVIPFDESGKLDPSAIPYFIAIAVFFYLSLALTVLIVGTWYQSKFWRFRAAHTQCEGLRFAMPNVTAWKLMRLLVGNWLLAIVSLGLLTPLVMQRSMRFWCRHLRISGTIDLQAIAQAEGGPRTGEGLAGFFDIDVG